MADHHPAERSLRAEIRTHYPRELDDEVAHHPGGAPTAPSRIPDLIQILARFTRYRAPASVISAQVVRHTPLPRRWRRLRGTVRGRSRRERPWHWIVDLGTVIDVLGGKLEFESGRGPRTAVLEHLLSG